MSTALTYAFPAPSRAPALFVPAFPTIRPELLLRRGTAPISAHYPFSEPGARYYHFARNAIWRAVKALGLDRGEVLVPAYHHGVEIEALLDAGARVRFYRVGADLQVDLEDVASKIRPQTTALYLTHFLGFPGPVQAMKDLAGRHGLPLIEDCALALLSADGEMPLGLTGDVAVFCLYKVLAVPDGGVLVHRGAAAAADWPAGDVPRPPPLASSLALTASSVLRNVALRGGRPGRALRALALGVGKRALSASRVEPVRTGSQHFDREHASLGMSRLSERLLQVQDVPAIIERRRRNYAFLLQQLRDLSAPLFESLPPGVVPLCYPLLVDDNRRVMEQLLARGIEAVDFWREGHPACDVAAFPEVAWLRRSVLEVPCHQDLSLETLAVVADVIREVLAGQPRLARPGAPPAERLPSSPALELHDVVDRSAFAALAGEWNALAGASGRGPFQRHEYIRSFLDNFLPEAPLRVITGRDGCGRLVVALPLVAGRGSICGLGVRELASPTNVHSLRFDVLAEDGKAAAEALLPHLLADSSWDVVRITDVPEGGQAWHLYRAAQLAGCPVGAWESQRSPYVELPAAPGDPTRGLSAKFRANLRRRRKRLAEQGEISVERFASAALTEERLDECLLLERSGWKGRQGSAAQQSPATHGFHRDLLRAPGFQDLLSLTVLKLAGEPIAFDHGLTSHGVYSLVMTSYDERFKEFSPGHLVTEDVLKDCVARGLRQFDFLGCDLPWKLDWTKTVRPHHWLYIFRDSARGRLLRQVKFGWVRRARQWASRWSGPSPVRVPPGEIA